MSTYTRKPLVRLPHGQTTMPRYALYRMLYFSKRMITSGILTIKYFQQIAYGQSRDLRLFMEEIQELNVNNWRKLQSHFAYLRTQEKKLLKKG